MQRWQAAKSRKKISGQGSHLATHSIFHVYPWAGVWNVISPELSYWLLIFDVLYCIFSWKIDRKWESHRGCECCSCVWNNIHEKSPVSPRSTSFAPPLRVGYLVFVKIIYPKDWMVNSNDAVSKHPDFQSVPPSISSRSKRLQASPSCPNLLYGSEEILSLFTPLEMFLLSIKHNI